MSNERMKATVGAALAVLGFRAAVGKDRWRFSAADEPAITALLDGKAVYIKAEGTTLTCKVPRPLGEDFVPRLRKRLDALRKSAGRATRAQKRAFRKTIKSTDVTATQREPSAACGGNSRSYDPLGFCDTCHRMIRASLMATEKECRDCRSER